MSQGQNFFVKVEERQQDRIFHVDNSNNRSAKNRDRKVFKFQRNSKPINNVN